MLAKEELQQFLELYAKENERVAEEYIGDGQRLFSMKLKIYRNGIRKMKKCRKNYSVLCSSYYGSQKNE